MDNAIPFPNRRDTTPGLGELNDRLRELREMIAKGADAHAVACAVAPLFLESIGRMLAFSNQLDAAHGYCLFLEGHPFEENARRARVALRIHRELMELCDKALEGLLKCLGGKHLVAVQAMSEWAAKNSGHEPKDPKQEELINMYIKDFYTRAMKLRASE